MYKIVETQAQFKEFISKCNSSDVILHPIMSDHNLHSLNNDICGIYIKIIDGDSLKGFSGLLFTGQSPSGPAKVLKDF